MKSTTLIKDLQFNNQEVWFKPKSYGYGWTPNNKYGWMVVGFLVLEIILSTVTFAINTAVSGESKLSIVILLPSIASYLINLFVVIGVTIILTRLTGESTKSK